MRFEPIYAAYEKVIPLGFLGARVFGSKQISGEHLSILDVSSQETMVLDYTKMWKPICRGSKSVRVCHQGSNFTA